MTSVLVVTAPIPIVVPPDSQAPTIPTWVSQSTLSGGSSTLTFDAPTDPTVSAITGQMSAVEVYKNGSYNSEVAYGPGTSPVLSLVEVGMLSAGSVTQTGNDYRIICHGGLIFYTSSLFTAKLFATGTAHTQTFNVSAFSSTDPYSKVGVYIGQDQTGPAKYAALLFTPFSPGNGLLFEGRNSTGGSAATLGTGSASYRYARLIDTGTTATAWGSVDGKSWTQIGTAFTHNITSTRYYGPIAGHGSGGDLDVTVVNYSSQPTGELTKVISGTAGDSITLKARDVTGNRSAASPAAILANPAAASGFNAPYIGLAAYGNPHAYDDPAFIAHMGKYPVVMLGAYDGWDNAHSASGYTKLTLRQVCSQGKAIAAAISTMGGTPLYTRYTIHDSAELSSGSGGRRTTKIINENWWLYASGTSGTILPHPWNPATQGIVNFSLSCSVDGEGLKWVEWSARDAYRMSYEGDANGNSSNNLMDGQFFDNYVPYPIWGLNSDGTYGRYQDWERDGVSEYVNGLASDASVLLKYRAGNARAVAYAETQWPSGSQMWANVSNYEYGVDAGSEDVTQLGTQNQILTGGLKENYLNESGYSTSAWLLRSARIFRAACKSGRYIIAEHLGVNSTSYKAIRFGLALCTQQSLYYNGQPSGSTDSRLWFDEYDAGVGTGWLGQPNNSLGYGGIPTTAWQNGIYRRDFDNGSVFWNPNGNGSKSFTNPRAGHRLTSTGKSDASINSGAAVALGATVNMSDADGFFLKVP